MHRHGYQGRKFRRERDQRKALIKGLATQLVEHGSIETTIQKAKEIVPYVEVLITKAKRGDLHSRRQVISSLTTIAAAHKLVDDIAPQLGGRTSGHLRIKRTRARVGDNAELARVSFVDELKPTEAEAEAPVAAEEAAPKTAAKKAA
ncbi:50S ribosomal protein L17 [Candidatus Saccharibacteria bacterium]|nr:MAG: 50S ribosomal protein L17 [Candidatus Saccharibacteria bacterium]